MNLRPERPLSFAVFGRPGSGKSFGVNQVAKAVDSDDLVEKVDFNLSQWESPAELVVALHRVRDIGLRGKTPLVFFDEFDCDLRGDSGWLKYFSCAYAGWPVRRWPPHSSGGSCDIRLSRRDVLDVRGVRPQCQAAATKHQGHGLSRKAAGLRERLRRGFSGPIRACYAARCSSRETLFRKCPQLFDARGTLRIDSAVLAAFLNVPEYFTACGPSRR